MTAELSRADVGPGDPDAQATVLSRPVSARLLVDAGPGTGKTWVACHRVARLIDQGIAPSRIWMISFTRTAVAEIRSRIAGALSDPDDALGVRIATLDAHAWALQSGFDADARLTGSHEDNIEATLGRVKTDELLQEELGRLRHLIVDEAQDILGVRADLTMEIIQALDEHCGVTAFADEAQSIYGFSEDITHTHADGDTLAARLHGHGFETMRLERIHRTDCPNLMAIFRDLRRTILEWSDDVADLDATVREEIARLAHAQAGEQKDLDLASLPSGALVLMRRRVDVLSVSSLMAEVPHRLRMSGLPPAVASWLAMLLWDFDQPRLSHARFEALWEARRPDGDPLIAWGQMLEVAGEPGGLIDLRRLRGVLGRSSPPAMFCAPEFGATGPILGTIHASKGREADEVVLYLPQVGDDEPESAEEVRVLFVGATRARRRLSVGNGSGHGGGSHQGRAWRYTRNGRIQVEVGRSRDLHADDLVGRTIFGGADEAVQAQMLIATHPVQSGLKAGAARSLNWRYELLTSGNERLGALSTGFADDIRQIANQTHRWPPASFFPFLRSTGLRSLVLRPDDPVLETLHEPWRSSGFVLAPLLTGFSPAKFGKASS